MEGPHPEILQKFEEGLAKQPLLLLSFLLEEGDQAEKHIGPDVEVHPSLPDHERKQDEDVPEFGDGGGSAFDEGEEGVPGVEVEETQQEWGAVRRGQLVLEQRVGFVCVEGGRFTLGEVADQCEKRGDALGGGSGQKDEELSFSRFQLHFGCEEGRTYPCIFLHVSHLLFYGITESLRLFNLSGGEGFGDEEVEVDDFIVEFEEGLVDIGGGGGEPGEGGRRGVVLRLVLEEDYLFRGGLWVLV